MANWRVENNYELANKSVMVERKRSNGFLPLLIGILLALTLFGFVLLVITTNNQMVLK